MRKLERYGSRQENDTEVESGIRLEVAEEFQDAVIELYRICAERTCGTGMLFEELNATSLKTKPQYPREFPKFVQGMGDDTHAWLLQKVDGFRGHAKMKEGAIRIYSASNTEIWEFPFRLGGAVRGSGFEFIGELYLQVMHGGTWVTVNHWGMTLFQAFLKRHPEVKEVPEFRQKWRVRFGVFWLHALGGKNGCWFVPPRGEPHLLLRAMLEKDDGSPVDPDFHLIRAYGRILKEERGLTYQTREADGTFASVRAFPDPQQLYEYLLRDCADRRWEGAVAYDRNRPYVAKLEYGYMRPSNQVKIKGIPGIFMCAKFHCERRGGAIEVYQIYALDGSGEDQYLRACGRLRLKHQTDAVKAEFARMEFYRLVQYDFMTPYGHILPGDAQRMRKISADFNDISPNYQLVGNRAVWFVEGDMSNVTRIRDLRTPYYEQWANAYRSFKQDLRTWERVGGWLEEAKQLAEEGEESADEMFSLMNDPLDGPMEDTPRRPAIPSPDPPRNPPPCPEETQVWEVTGRMELSPEAQTQRMSPQPVPEDASPESRPLSPQHAPNDPIYNARWEAKRRVDAAMERIRMNYLRDRNLPKPVYRYAFLGEEYTVPTQQYEVYEHPTSHVKYVLECIAHALEDLAICFTEYQKTMVSMKRERYDGMMNTALKKLIGLLLDETLALNRPAMNELAAFVGWKIILVEDDEWFRLEGGRLRLGSKEVRELFKAYPLEELGSFKRTEEVYRNPSVAIKRTTERMEAAVLGHFKFSLELNERYFLEKLRRKMHEQYHNGKDKEFAEEIADVIGPARAGYGHTVRERFSSKYCSFLLKELVRLLNLADSKYMFAEEVHKCIDRYLQ